MAEFSVRLLISRLRQFPPEYKVGFATGDNTESEVFSDISSVGLLEPGEHLDDQGPTVMLRG